MDRNDVAREQAPAKTRPVEMVEPVQAEARPAEPVGREPRDGRGDGMVEMAGENVKMHLAPSPLATAPEVAPFPRSVLVGAGGGLVVGALVGLSFGLLLLDGTVVIPGWEQLYSMTPGTFAVFWMGIGAAAGLLLIGVVSLLVIKPQRHPAATPKAS